MNLVAEDILMHYGTKRHSGRYPWGSGENPYQHSGDFLSRVHQLEKEGMSEKEIAENMGIEGFTVTKLRAYKSIANAERRSLLVERAKSLQKDGYNTSEIARIMGYNNESSVRSLLNSNSEVKMHQAEATANVLKKLVDEKTYIDIGAGAEKELGNISKEKLNMALMILEDEGYQVYSIGLPQVTNPGKQTVLKVLCPEGTEASEVYTARDENRIASVANYISSDGGDSYHKSFEYPASMDSKRIEIHYKEDGGGQKDGLVEIRPGVKDLSLDGAAYAQVRILIDGTHYVKGMATYGDPKDFPKGVDVIFNTGKSSSKNNKFDILKPITDDPDNPFGSAIKENGGQHYYDDPNGSFTNPTTGKKQSLSLINKTRDEGDWEEWSKSLPSQFLSKQSQSLITQQLKLSETDKQVEYNEICSVTNPTVKRQLLESFANDCDSAAVHLQAAALPRQTYQVLYPIPSMKDNEVYAPNFENGEKVALVRYPHAGTFEIPVLTVNNKQTEGVEKLGKNASDVVGINSHVAGILSGADFDGDAVTVIPCNSSNSKTHIVTTDPKSSPALKALAEFEPKDEYSYDKKTTDSDGTVHFYRNGTEYKPLSKGRVQNEMGNISNLITDMTLQGASYEELARAVRHSMVIIDAYKHDLDYKQSAKDNGIPELKEKYQGRSNAGAATLISKSKSQVSVDRRQGSPRINKETGEVYWKTTDDLTYSTAKVVNKNGGDNANATIRIGKKGQAYVQLDDSNDNRWIKVSSGASKLTEGARVEVALVENARKQQSVAMRETNDAHTLSSGTPQEEAYADYANKMKSLANQARLEMINTPRLKYDASAAKTYSKEVASLNSKLNVALKEAPRERQAQLMANSVVKGKQQENPDMSKEAVRKASQQALTNARISVGASRQSIDITPKEWEAIQAGAISDNKLSQILNHTDNEKIRQYATPRKTNTLSNAEKAKIKAMSASGYTNEEIAKALGCSISTVTKYLKS